MTETERVLGAVSSEIWLRASQIAAVARVSREAARVVIRQGLADGRLECQQSSPVSMKPARLFRRRQYGC